jgi:phosphatidylglycerol:prolipoprotein diacylglycerol transferase
VRPILLRIPVAGGELAIGAYGTFYLLAWVAGPLVGAWFAAQRGVGFRRALALCYGALAAGIVGARLLDLFIAGGFYADTPSRVWSMSFQGFSLYGGLVVACVSAIALARVLRLPVWRLADASVPGIVVGIVFMRVGCLLRGCCSGEITTPPWGVTYPVGSMPWANQVMRGQTGLLNSFVGGTVMQPVHPTQLYEMLGAVVAGVLALVLLKRGGARMPDGVAFLAFAAGFTAVRLLNDFVRVRQDVITAPAWFYPVFYACAMVVLTGLIVWRVAQERARRRGEAAIYP